MKKIFISIIAALFTFISSAQIAPPKQTDTLIVTSVRYNYTDIRKENWPIDTIYKSTTSFQIGADIFDIMEVCGSFSSVRFVLSDSEKKETYILDFEEYSKKNVKIEFSGYEFRCTYKELQHTILNGKYITEDKLKSMCKEQQHNDVEISAQMVEEKPSFNGGDANQFAKWVNSRLEYPRTAEKSGIQGRVTLQFTIETDGSVTNVKVLRGVEPSLDKEAIRVVSMSPKWSPGKQGGSAVPVTYTFPVIFQLR